MAVSGNSDAPRPKLVVLRPDAAAWSSRVSWGALLATLTFSAAIVVIDHRWLAAAITTLWALFVGPIFMYFRNVRLDISDQTIARTGLFGRVRRWDRNLVKGCAQRSVIVSYYRPRPSNYLIFYGEGHRTLFKLNGNLWNKHAIGQINSALGYKRRAEVASDRTYYRDELLREFPGSIDFVSRHQWLVGGGGAILAIGLLTYLGVAFHILK